ncbi:MAG: EAL domain-containing protein [Clostridiaceae bacterium]|nr:EAL domain-containing protein [Clostridiaceae bacterium]
MEKFTKIEIGRAHKDTEVALKYIGRDLINLNSLNLDYARWTDTYNYLNIRNNEYITVNFDDTISMARSKVSFIFIIDNLENIIYKKNIEDDTEDIFTDDLSKNIISNVSKSFSSSNKKNVVGPVLYDKVPILISAERITKSDGFGTSPGILIFARYYDSDQIAAINENTQLETELIAYNEDITLDNNDERKDTFIRINNKNSITGYGLVDDIFSEPSFFVKVNLQREIFKKAEYVLNSYFLILFVVSVSISLGIFALIHVFVVKRINNIKAIVENVNSSHDLSSMITLKGNDEVSELGSKFNNMFSRLKRSDETIFTLAYYDALTGLPNRKKLLEKINNLLEDKRVNFAFLFIDLDNFKSINDNFGHEAGDIVLVEVAHRLKNSVRSMDIVSRIGGDEFIVIIKDLVSVSDAIEVAEELVKILSATFVYYENIIYIGASIGISLFPEHGIDVDTLIKNADIAMYEAKNSGGNGYMVYNNIMKDNAIDKLEMKKNLKNAMEKDEFITYYQPIIHVESMKILSAESLIRWKRENKIIQPIEFIPIAKLIGEIVTIDNWMLDNACSQCKEWQKLGLKEFSISVNTSYKQLIQLNFVEIVMNILNKYSLDPGYLNLEVTEDEAMEDIDIIMTVLSALKSQGVKISMDDFGTGYSSLSYINRLPIDTIKIDKSLIINLENNSKNIVIIKSIVVMANSLNIKVVAEGIETEAEFTKLKELQCDYIQGYLIGKPMTADDFQHNFLK